MAKNDIKVNAKLMLDIDDTSEDEKIDYLISSVELKILRYCGILELPIELEDVVAQIVINRINQDETIVTKVGGITLQAPKSEKPINELEPHKDILNKYKKLSFV